MQIDATLISHCYNGINLNEDRMKTTGDRIEQLLRDFGRARYEGAPAYTQIELVEMLTGERQAPNGKYYKVNTNKSTVSRILTDKQELPYDVLFAICDMFDTDTEWILRGNVLEPERIPDKFNTDEANEVGAMIDAMLPRSRLSMLVLARNLAEADKEDRRKDIEITRFLQSLDQSLTHLTDSQRSEIADILYNFGAGKDDNHRGYSNGKSSP